MKQSLITTAILVLLYSFAYSQVQYEIRNYSIDFSGEGVEFVNYWNGTGFTPGDLLFRKDMQLTLDYQAAIPNQGMRYVRPHWLLNLGHGPQSRIGAGGV